ncbi:hypothetical protein [Algimonas porphyrae]|uniref:Uncharacterized protein n=3 Tax=Algimonas porphyrae TaxID=1128113 RepID=A0ABQ5V3E3_9PROT|nr:hypothetical protein GCM10007854_17370 [Algimonas porphyrae]
MGSLGGYAVLLGLLFAVHDTPWGVMDRLTPFLIIGSAGLALSIGPLIFARWQEKRPITGRGPGKACSHEALAPQRIIGLMAMGMMLGALISQTVKLFIS